MSAEKTRRVAYALKNLVDVIVVGPHGRTAMSRTLLGSVAEAVVRHATRPVAAPEAQHG